MKTPELIERLRGRHPMTEGQWATIVEFTRIDFLAVGTWPSTGYVVHGYELKASRSDWLRELKDPAKSADGMAKVDFWWLAAPAGVVKDLAEIPERWGYLLVSERGTSVVKQAPRLRGETPRSNLAPGANGRMIPDSTRAERTGFAMMARRLAYAEADRDALAAAAEILDTVPALDAAALATGRWTKGAKLSKADWEKKLRERERAHRAEQGRSGQRKRRGPKQEYVGW